MSVQGYHHNILLAEFDIVHLKPMPYGNLVREIRGVKFAVTVFNSSTLEFREVPGLYETVMPDGPVSSILIAANGDTIIIFPEKHKAKFETETIRIGN